jgi:hypothetical protein
MDLLELPDSSPSASTLVLGQSPQRTTGRGGRSGARALAQLMPSPPRSTLAEPSASRFGPPAFDRSTGSFLLGGAAANCSASPPLVALLGPHALAAAASAAASASASAVGCLRNDDARGGVRDYGLSVSPPSPALPWAQHQGAVARPTATALSVPASGCARVAHSLGGKPIGDAAFTQTAKSSLHLTAAAPKRCAHARVDRTRWTAATRDRPRARALPVGWLTLSLAISISCRRVCPPPPPPPSQPPRRAIRHLPRVRVALRRRRRRLRGERPGRPPADADQRAHVLSAARNLCRLRQGRDRERRGRAAGADRLAGRAIGRRLGRSSINASCRYHAPHLPTVHNARQIVILVLPSIAYMNSSKHNKIARAPHTQVK